MDKSTKYSERISIIESFIYDARRHGKFIPCKCIFQFDGKGFIDGIKNRENWSDSKKIAAIAIARATVFGLGDSLTFLPPDPELIMQFWNQAVDVLNGEATLFIDLCDINKCANDERERDRRKARLLGNSSYMNDAPHRVYPSHAGLPIAGPRRIGGVFPHKILNCTNNSTYYEYYPYIYWWDPVSTDASYHRGMF